MGDFLAGRNHGEILERLVSLTRRSQAENPRVVVIEGLSGVGKTRIVQELYRTLQAEEAEAARSRGATTHDAGEAFWPPFTAGMVGGQDHTMADRKRIGPELDGFYWPKNALPTFAWWAISCDRDSAGRPTDVMSALSPAFREFQLPLRLAALRQDRRGAITDWMRELTEIAKFQASSFAEDQLISAIMSLVPIPGASFAIDLGKDLLRAGKRRYDERAALTSSMTIGGFQENRDDAAKLAAELIESMRPGLPTIVVVEDIHLMSASVERFLTGLLAAPAAYPVLIVGTAWPHYELNDRYTQWCESIEATWLVSERVEGLDDGDLAELVLHRAPGTNRRVREALAEKYPNPLALKIALSLGPVTRSVRGERGSEAIDLNDDDICHLPHTMEELRLAQWNALPSDVQEALTIAAASLGGEQAIVGDFDRELVARAAGRAKLVAAEAVESGLHEARDPLGWSRSSEAALTGWEQFREPAYAELARAQFSTLWLERDRGLLVEAMIGELRTQVAERTEGGKMLDPRSSTDVHLAEWLIALGPDIETREDVFSQVVAAVAAFWRQDDEAAGALLAVREAWLEYVDAGDLNTLAVRREIIHAVGAVEGWQKAADEFTALAAEVERLVAERSGAEQRGELDAERLENLHMAAYATGLAGEWSRAGKLFERVVAERQLALGFTHPRTLEAYRNCAYAYDSAGELDHAADVYRRLLTDSVDGLGENDEHSVEARVELARTIRSAAFARPGGAERDDLTVQARTELEFAVRLLRENTELNREWLGTCLYEIALILVQPPFPQVDMRLARTHLLESAAINAEADAVNDVNVWTTLSLLTIAETVLEQRNELPPGTWAAASDRALRAATACDSGDGGDRVLREWKRRAESFAYCDDLERAIATWRELERLQRDRDDVEGAEASARAAASIEHRLVLPHASQGEGTINGA